MYDAGRLKRKPFHPRSRREEGVGEVKSEGAGGGFYGALRFLDNLASLRNGRVKLLVRYIH